MILRRAKPTLFSLVVAYVQKGQSCWDLADVVPVYPKRYTNAPKRKTNRPLKSYRYWRVKARSNGFYRAGGPLLLPPPRGDGKKGRRGKKKEKEKGKRERKKKRSYEGVPIHCNEEEVEKKTSLITKLERSIA
jgi:hypothetical protein